jgi:hypothetical protein
VIEVAGFAIAWWVAVLAVVVTVVGSARLTRVITHDDYPPAMALRIWWDTVTKDGPWAKLVHCPWCLGPWVTLGAIVSFLVSFSHPALGWAWWLFWGWLTLSYWTSQYVHFDEGRSDDS